ncbi:RHS repeat-associated core domain-containing protein [Chitinophaga barathri]|uniref:RHS repeat-associated core domain-containing protein n=2 Tax=Chitinophaga barathri TaxID=1647451 RepID=A0A3N4M869_9BACT|nr:RHS repeat-associated core domain-containing protein [Chitinophaga barathri]
MTALYPSNSTRAQLQTAMDGATASSPLNYTAPGTADLVVGNRQAGLTSYKATNSILFQAGFDSETAAEFVAEIDPSLQGLTTQVTVTNPLPNITGYQPLTYTFYDKYDYTGSHSLQTADLSKPQAGTNPYAEAATAASTMTQGLITGTRVRVLGTADQWLTTTLHYDNKGRVIQTISDNTGGGKDIATSLYDFNGKVLSSYLRHTNPRSGATPQTTMLTMNQYDAAGRLRAVKKKLNDNATLERTVATMDYDELGQLKEKRLGVTGASEQLEKLAFEYNIRGWLKGINKAFVTTPASTTNWFGQEMSYDYGFAVNQYNGNIGGIKWKSGGDYIQRAHGFGYDKANRLTYADFNQQNSSTTTWQKNLVDFSVSNLAYDANGNILSMTQKGLKAGANATIDQLSYAYYANSNRLRYVRDNVNDITGTLGDFKEPTANNSSNQGDPTTDFDYSYDVNGNLTADKNKEITGIVYNHLNLPQTITITGKGSIAYQYDAAGIKLKKTVTDNTANPAKVTTTDYMAGGMVYENDTLQLLGHEEGRIRTVFESGQPLQYEYDYFVKDHLGNVRVVLTEQDDFSMYMASMETESAAKENALFSNIDASRASKPAGYPEDATTEQNSFVAKLNGQQPDKKIGPSLVLKVMTGDTIQVGARAFYKSGPVLKNKNAVPQDMLGALISVFGNGGNAGEPGHGATAAAVNNTPFNNDFNDTYQRLKEKNKDASDPQRPKAYLNFVLFDEQFNLVEDNSGVKQVQATPDELQTLAQDKMVMKKSGFLYVYTSNESPQDVYFDNVMVLALPGPMLEETHYYPFGLTMAGISTSATYNKLRNKYRYNGKELQNKEFSNGGGLEWYDYGARMMDPQIGRWHVGDPMVDKSPEMSTYSYVRNNPISKIDPDGNTDYDVVIKTSKDPKSGALVRTANVNVVYNVINLSRKDIYNTGQIAGGEYNSSTFSRTLQFAKGEAGLKEGLSVTVNVNITYKLVNDINKVNNNENVLLLVNDVVGEGDQGNNLIGLAELPGQTAAIEGDKAGNKSLVHHEMGHNFGLEHVDQQGNLMSSTPKTTNLTTKQLKQIFSALAGMKDGTFHMGGRNAKAETKSFVENRNIEYDENKAKKAGF